MNNSLKPLLSLSLAAALAFGLAGCSKDPEPTPTPSPSTSTATASPTATAKATPSPSATPTATPSSTAAPVVVENELETARKGFPAVEAEGNISKDEIQLAALSATRYATNIYNSGYLANGSWYKNGADSQELVNLYGKDWSDAYRVKIESLIERTKTGSEEEKTAAGQELLVHFFFYINNDEKLTLPDDCKDNNVGVGSCLVDGTLQGGGDTTYEVNQETGAIYINFLFTANVKFVKDGVQGVTPVHYDVQLEMIKNPYPDAENLRYAYIVNDLGGSWKFENWHEGE